MKRIGLWVGIVLLVQVVAYFAVFEDLAESIEYSEKLETYAREDYLDKKKAAVHLDPLREQLREAEAKFGTVGAAVPDRFESGLEGVAAAAKARGLRLDNVRPDDFEYWRDFYAVRTVRVRLTGQYHALAGFVADLAAAPGSYRVREFEMLPDQGGALTMETSLQATRYVSSDEVTAARRWGKDTARKYAQSGVPIGQDGRAVIPRRAAKK